MAADAETVISNYLSNTGAGTPQIDIRTPQAVEALQLLGFEADENKSGRFQLNAANQQPIVIDLSPNVLIGMPRTQFFSGVRRALMIEQQSGTPAHTVAEVSAVIASGVIQR